VKTIGILAIGNEEGGGTYQYTQSLIDALCRDSERKYVIFINSNDHRFDNSNVEKIIINKPKYRLYEKIIKAFQLLLFIRKPLFFTKYEIDKFKDIDLFICPIISEYPHFYLNKPFIFTLHDFQERYYPYFFSPYQKILRWLNNRALAQSSEKIVCESEYVKNDIIKFTKVSSKKIFVINAPPPKSFLDFEFDDEYKFTVIKKYDLPSKYLFYPAQHWFHKNHINLIKAFKIVLKKKNDLYLILSGSEQNNTANIKKLINELNLTNRVRLIGFINYNDMPYIYKLSQMLVMPSLFESISIPIYEAFSLKVPVCSSNAVGLSEQVARSGLLFNPNNPQDIAEKILNCFKKTNLSSNIVEMGYKNVIRINHDEYKTQLTELIKHTSF